jgi:hypothetical protein
MTLIFATLYTVSFVAMIAGAVGLFKLKFKSSKEERNGY